MDRTIKAKFKNGVIEPLENLDIKEDEELLVTVRSLVAPEDRFKRAMGSWRGTVDCEQLIKDIYDSRWLSTARPGIKL